MVNLLVWGADEWPAQIPLLPAPGGALPQVDSVRGGPNNPPASVDSEPLCRHNWKRFGAAVVARAAADSHLGCPRFGAGRVVQNGLNGSGRAQWTAHGGSRQFRAHTRAMPAWEASRGSSKQLAAGAKTDEEGDGLSAAAAVACGVGTRGRVTWAVSARSRPLCRAHRCGLLARCAGRVRLEGQTREVSAPNGPGPGGSSPPSLHFAWAQNTWVVELHPTQWRVVGDPARPGARARLPQGQALVAAAAAVSTGAGR